MHADRAAAIDTGRRDVLALLTKQGARRRSYRVGEAGARSAEADRRAAGEHQRYLEEYERWAARRVARTPPRSS